MVSFSGYRQKRPTPEENAAVKRWLHRNLDVTKGQAGRMTESSLEQVLVPNWPEDEGKGDRIYVLIYGRRPTIDCFKLEEVEGTVEAIEIDPQSIIGIYGERGDKSV